MKARLSIAAACAIYLCLRSRVLAHNISTQFPQWKDGAGWFSHAQMDLTPYHHPYCRAAKIHKFDRMSTVVSTIETQICRLTNQHNGLGFKSRHS